MQRSDPPRPAGADPAAANSDPQKSAAESPSPEPADDAFAEADTEAAERTHFKALERETTQPVRRYFEPRSVIDIAPADVGYAVDYAVPVEEAAIPSSDAQPPQAEVAPLEPWPEPLPATPVSESERQATEPLLDEFPAAGDEERAPERVAEPAALEPSPAAEVAPPALEEPEPTPPPPAHAFEPSPFAVPAPRAAPPPSFEPSHIEPAHSEPWPQPEPDQPASYELRAAKPVAPSPEPEPPAPVVETQASGYAEPEWREPAREPEPEPDQCETVPLPEPPPVTLQHDVAAAWSPAPTLRREPTFARAEPSWQRDTASVAPLEPADRDYRDLFRRGVGVAVLVFCGWLIGVMLLIVAYRFINPPFSMLMVQQFLTGTAIHKQWVPIERISPNLTRAVIVAEDGRFCDHWGVDFIEAANAIRRASDGYPRGASTITMQVAKNLFLVNTKSYLRKMVEIPLTFAIELAWPKWRILEVYLNVVEWGPGVFGAEAASQSHFGRSAAGLTARQAAQLAVSLPNPIVRDAGSPGPRTAHRASVIQARAARTREASACVDGVR